MDATLLMRTEASKESVRRRRVEARRIDELRDVRSKMSRVQLEKMAFGRELGPESGSASLIPGAAERKARTTMFESSELTKFSSSNNTGRGDVVSLHSREGKKSGVYAQ